MFYGMYPSSPHTCSSLNTQKRPNSCSVGDDFPAHNFLPHTHTHLSLQDLHKGQAMNRSKTTAYLPFYSFQSPCLPFPFLKIKEKALYSTRQPINSSQRLQKSNHTTRPWLGLKSLHGITLRRFQHSCSENQAAKGKNPLAFRHGKLSVCYFLGGSLKLVLFQQILAKDLQAH